MDLSGNQQERPKMSFWYPVTKWTTCALAVILSTPHVILSTPHVILSTPHVILNEVKDQVGFSNLGVVQAFGTKPLSV